MDYKDYLEQKNKAEIHFWYRARLELLAYLLKKVFSKNKNSKNILNVGCGTGTENKEIKKYGQITALDIDRDALQRADRDDCQVLFGDIEVVALKDGFFDLVCAFDILEHLEKDELVIKKLYDCLSFGGKLIFTVPAFKFLYGSHDIALEHKRRYNKKEIQDKLKKVGFEIVEIGYWNFILFPLEVMFRIIKKIIFKVFKISNHTTEIKYSNNFLNKFLYLIMKQDIRLIRKKIALPFGLTIYGIAKKNKFK